MNKYDKQFVYFEWDEKLMGHKVFVGNTIDKIKEIVNSGKKYDDEVYEIKNEDDAYYLFKKYNFAYYDPFYDSRDELLKDGEFNECEE